MISAGVVNGVILTSPGSDYISAPTVTLTGGGGANAAAKATLTSGLAPAPGATVGALTEVQATFSEPVTGVDAGDLLLNGAPATAVTGSGVGPYVFTFPQPAVGTVTFAWAGGHGIQDTAATPNAFAGGTWTVTRSATGVGNLVINEFLAANGLGLADENLDPEDWIEIFNAGASTVNLAGWALTDEPEAPGEVGFPRLDAGSGSLPCRFCLGQGSSAGAEVHRESNGASAAISLPRLHTNFTINENGGYLALISPESPRAVVSQFPPDYNPLAIPPITQFPEQRTDYSYGPQPGVH
jgi:hypothetical protein